MFDIFGFLKKKPSKETAVNRLKLVLVQDKMNCSTQVLEMLKSDILNVISNYMEIDEKELDVKITQTEIEGSEGVVPVLYANIPIKGMHKNQG